MLRARRARDAVVLTKSCKQYHDALISGCTQNLDRCAQRETAATKHSSRQVSTGDGYWDRSRALIAAQRVDPMDNVVVK